jgi:hypothetical protein
MGFALCLRMRKNNIKSVTIGNKGVGFETFRDNYSTFVYVPIIMERAGTVDVIIKHPAN